MEPSILKGEAVEMPTDYSRPKPTFNLNADDEANKSRRAKAKRLETILTEHGKPFSVPTSDRDLNRLTEMANNLRICDISHVMQQLRNARNADLCFVIDATGSMDAHIAEVKDVIGNIVTSLTKPAIRGNDQSSVLSTLRLACVAYRDHSDGVGRLEKLDFTWDVNVFRKFLGSLKAFGGDDGPEDVLGGLHSTQKLTWSANSGVKQVFHIGDAPPHGTQFHTVGMRDNYPCGHSSDPTVAEIFNWMAENKVFYVFGKINDSTNIMLEKFTAAALTPLPSFDVGKPDMIESAVIESVTSSVITVVSASRFPPTTVASLRRVTINKAIPYWERISEVKCRLMSLELPKSISDVVNDVAMGKKTPKVVYVKIASNPFAEGAERLAYYGLDVTSLNGVSQQIPVIFKEFKRIGKGLNSANKYEMVNQLQTLSSFMAFQFTDELKKVLKTSPPSLKFLKVKSFACEVPGGYRFMTNEKRFGPEAKFVRFSNNAGYVMTPEKAREYGVDLKFCEMIMAFSHWTHTVTGGHLIIVDLEGIIADTSNVGDVQIILTDPAIHCVNLDRFGELNHGIEGIRNFFKSHECNEFCKALKLTKPGRL